MKVELELKETCPWCQGNRFVKALVPIWPFRGGVCLGCGEAVLFGGPIRTWLWETFVWPFWGGQVRIRVKGEPDGD